MPRQGDARFLHGLPVGLSAIHEVSRRYGEVMAIEKLPYLTIKSMGAGFLDPDAKDGREKHHRAAKHAWSTA